MEPVTATHHHAKDTNWKAKDTNWKVKDCKKLII